jgi:hypothetical protein
MLVAKTVILSTDETEIIAFKFFILYNIVTYCEIYPAAKVPQALGGIVI